MAAVERPRLALPARRIGDVAVRQRPESAQVDQFGLNLRIAGLGLVDEAADARLIENLTHGHRLHRRDDAQQMHATTHHLGLRRSAPEIDAYCEIWLEKDALAGVVYPITAKYDVPLMVARGYASLTPGWNTMMKPMNPRAPVRRSEPNTLVHSSNGRFGAA
jgi:hypothetical protein